MRPAGTERVDTVLVIGPALAGASAVAAALRGRLDGCAVVEPADLPAGRIPDAVVFVASAAAPMSDCDTALFAAAAARTDAVVAAVTKIDVHRGWSAVLEANRSRTSRAVPWVGVAADPDVGPLVIAPLLDALRAELDDEHRRRRNLLRRQEWTLMNRLADREREGARRAALRARALAREAIRLQVQQARAQLAAEARARPAALRADAQREAAGLSRRALDAFGDRVHRRAQQIADDFEGSVAQRLEEISTSAGMPPRALKPAPPVSTHLPPLRSATQEDRLAAVFGAGFGLGAALTLGRLLAVAVPGAGTAVVLLCGVAGVALAAWVVRTRRLLTARAGMERWAAEAAAGLRAALEERLLAAESALLAAHASVLTAAGTPGGATADAADDGCIAELARVRAELARCVAPNPDHGRRPLRHNPP